MLLLSSVYAKMQINGNLLCMLWMGTIVQNPSAVIPLTWKEHIDGVWKQLALNLYTLMSFRNEKREKFWVIFVSFLKTWQYKWPSAPGETVFVLFFSSWHCMMSLKRDFLLWTPVSSVGTGSSPPLLHQLFLLSIPLQCFCLSSRSAFRPTICWISKTLTIR